MIIERSRIAAGASGKAGGFLSKTWTTSLTEELHRKSFELHEELAQSLNIASYQRVPTVEISRKFDMKSYFTASCDLTQPTIPEITTIETTFGNISKGPNIAYNGLVPWIRDDIVIQNEVANESAQVTPIELAHTLLEQAEAHGVRVLIDCVDGIMPLNMKLERGKCFEDGLETLEVATQCHGNIKAKKVVVCLGPWSGRCISSALRVQLL